MWLWQSAGQQHEVGVGEVGVFYLQVGLEGHAVRCLHKFVAGHADGLDVHAASSEDVYHCQGFHFLEAVGEKFIYLSHNFIFFIA